MLALLIWAVSYPPAVDGIPKPCIGGLYPQIPNGALDHPLIILVPFLTCTLLPGDIYPEPRVYRYIYIQCTEIRGGSDPRDHT